MSNLTKHVEQLALRLRNAYDPLSTQGQAARLMTAMAKSHNALQIEVDYYRAQLRQNPDEPRWKGGDVARHQEKLSEQARRELDALVKGTH